ncbi:MAG: sulfatase-like hydrolase/transferase [Bryobacteraceae bacterium]|nr:sulfatase-like hydrolase/transferase [Bryobacteraceae bacterium]
MDRRSFLLTGAAPMMAQPPRRPNVIVILTDDQGYGDLSAHGNPRLKTPQLDRLHAESVRLTDFHATPMCTPTRSQLMTGRDALTTQAMNVSSGRTLLRRDLPTMGEIFARAGYRTGIFGKWHLGDAYPYRPEDRGFQEALWFPSSHIGSTSDAWDNDYFNDRYRRNGRLERYKGYCTDVFFDEAMKWMRQRHAAAEPFFTYIPTNAPHGPLFVDPRYRERFKDLPPNVASFFGMITNIDENIGRLETMLKETGLGGNTIVVFMTDNGGTNGVDFYNAGMRGRKISLWEGGHRVPCFLRWPQGGLGGGRDVNELTLVQDILPTLTGLCGIAPPPGARFDGMDLTRLVRGEVRELPDRMAVVQFSRMNVGRPQFGDAAVLWRKWRLVSHSKLYDVAKDPAQQNDVAGQYPEIASRMREHYDGWWKNVSPRLDTFLPVHIGAEEENPALVSPTEWADVFLDQGTQIRRGQRKNGAWHVMVEHDGEYTFTLRRWPREIDVPMRAGLKAHDGEGGDYPAGVALPIARARLAIAALDLSAAVGAEDREAVFTLRLSEGWTKMQTWFYDATGQEISGAYFVYVERKTPVKRIGRAAVPVIFDTDIMGDVDDVGAVAMLHALENRGEARILAMGVCSKHPSSPACLDALNAHFQRPDLPVGVNKGEGFLRDTRYADKIAAAYKHRDTFPEAATLYRQVLENQPDNSVVMVSVGQCSNMSQLLKTSRDLVARKVKAWVCMGGGFPKGREANLKNDATAAKYAIENWPTPVIFSGFEIGLYVLTGGRMKVLPETNPVRRAYELYNGAQPHKSWDQTAVLYAVRCLDTEGGPWWSLRRGGACVIHADGANEWKDGPAGNHAYLVAKAPPVHVAAIIEGLMLGG